MLPGHTLLQIDIRMPIPDASGFNNPDIHGICSLIT